MNKPEALRLADWLDDQYDPTHNQEKAAAELRRLHAQRDALLEALKWIAKEFKARGRQHWPEAVRAQAAIAAVEVEEQA